MPGKELVRTLEKDPLACTVACTIFSSSSFRERIKKARARARAREINDEFSGDESDKARLCINTARAFIKTMKNEIFQKCQSLVLIQYFFRTFRAISISIRRIRIFPQSKNFPIPLRTVTMKKLQTIMQIFPRYDYVARYSSESYTQ